MLFGIVVGTSSSIFIAAPILLFLGENRLRREAAPVAKAPVPAVPAPETPSAGPAAGSGRMPSRSRQAPGT
jgi:preprotein translocase subunit SecD/preprotein translocase subunit SecF